MTSVGEEIQPKSNQRGTIMPQCVSRCLVIAGLFLSANMAAIPSARLLSHTSEIWAVGGIPGTPVQKFYSCLPSGTCKTCAVFTACEPTATPIYEEVIPGVSVQVGWNCNCSGGNDGCEERNAIKTCLLVCGGAPQQCELAPLMDRCGKVVHREFTTTVMFGERRCVPDICEVGTSQCVDCRNTYN